jgi:hypothetical protein
VTKAGWRSDDLAQGYRKTDCYPGPNIAAMPQEEWKARAFSAKKEQPTRYRVRNGKYIGEISSIKMTKEKLGYGESNPGLVSESHRCYRYTIPDELSNVVPI